MATPGRDGLDGHNGQRSIFRDASAQHGIGAEKTSSIKLELEKFNGTDYHLWEYQLKSILRVQCWISCSDVSFVEGSKSRRFLGFSKPLTLSLDLVWGRLLSRQILSSIKGVLVPSFKMLLITTLSLYLVVNLCVLLVSLVTCLVCCIDHKYTLDKTQSLYNARYNV